MSHVVKVKVAFEPTYKISDEDGEPMLIVRGQKRGGSIWIARIGGVSSKFKYNREFLGEQHKVISMEHDHGDVVEAGVRLSELKDGDLIEISSGGKWKWQRRAIYRYLVHPPRFQLMDDDAVKLLLCVPVQVKLPKEPKTPRKFRTIGD